MKLTTTQRNIIAFQAKDRIEREFAAMQWFRRSVPQDGDYWVYPDDCQCKECGGCLDKECSGEAKIELESLRKFKLPENLWLDLDAGFDDRITIVEAMRTIRRILSGKASIDEIDNLMFQAGEMEEFDLGWGVFGQPMGYYDKQSGPLWTYLKSKNIDCPLGVALCVIGGIIKNHPDEELIFHTMINQGVTSQRTGLDATINDIMLGADPMQAVKDILGDSLSASF